MLTPTPDVHVAIPARVSLHGKGGSCDSIMGPEIGGNYPGGPVSPQASLQEGGRRVESPRERCDDRGRGQREGEG